ncbi:hypothetical protein NDN08_004579 [Rhodosorus marinus]|uniref:C2 domain-containing protein n=1 Tax=Rhodosorus marinus TaxID=101924 RepID=A0AAV8UQT6_9RHOD|nr:hypothetical protein NDN08_004579 [Rhodosorus marinus]
MYLRTMKKFTIFTVLAVIGATHAIKVHNEVDVVRMREPEPEIDPPIPPQGNPSDYKNLYVRVVRAVGLTLRTEGWGAGMPDPYAIVTAYRMDGPPITRRTRTIANWYSPFWNQQLHFGTGRWQTFKVVIWDSDGWANGGDDLLLTTPRVSIDAFKILSCCATKSLQDVSDPDLGRVYVETQLIS